jgi:hypothetical protein
VIWLVWRQHRKQLYVALISLAVLTLVLIPTGRSAHKAISSYTTCLDKLGDADFIPADDADKCQGLAETFGASHETWAYAAILLLTLPLLIGLFWGAPLVAREVEQGTHRLVWTQGITRRRWAVTKFGLIGLTVVALSAIYSVLITWWMEPLNNSIADRFEYIFFDQQGVVPVSYTLFAVAVGVFAGSVMPRMIAAMGTTLGVFLFVRIAVAVFVRPNIQGDETKTALVAGPESGRIQPNPNAGSWLTASDVRAPDGTVLQGDGTGYCISQPDASPPPSPPPSPPAGATAGDGGGACNGWDPQAYNQWTYQPGDRFWLFQWVELGIYVALSAALLYAALRRVRQSIS